MMSLNKSNSNAFKLADESIDFTDPFFHPHKDGVLGEKQNAVYAPPFDEILSLI